MRSGKAVAALTAALALFLAPAAPGAEERAATTYALSPPNTGGLESVDRLLRKLGTHRRLLVIGAHPDDEDTELLALVSRAWAARRHISRCRAARAARTSWVRSSASASASSARRSSAPRGGWTAARQFFTRAYDFGFTRSLEETLQKWPREVLLEDAVRIVRRFRPQVVVSVFSGTSRDGHGQHQAAGVTAQEAYRRAADPAAPPLAAEGLTVWQPAALYRSVYFDPKDATLVLPTGGVDPLTGRSYYQIAMASRSLHRSQDMGMLQEPGPNETRVSWIDGGKGKEATELFAGVDTRLRAIAGEVPDAARRADMERRLDRVASLTQEARRRLSTPDLAGTAPVLAEALSELRAARALARPGDGGTAMLLDEKIALAEGALAGAAGVTLDVLAEREVAAPGESVEITVDVWNAGGQPVSVESVSLESPDGWTVPAAAAERAVAPGKLEEWKMPATVPPGAAPTLPYFLYAPMHGDLYDWSATPASVRGEPFQPAPLHARVVARISGVSVALERDASLRFRDQAIGEIRRPVRAAPPLDVAVEPDLLVWPPAQKEKRLEITLTSNAGRPLAGSLEVAPPPGWPVPPPRAFSLAKRGERQFFDIPLVPPAALPAGRAAFRIAAVLAGGERMELGVRLIDYGYIPRTPMPNPTDVSVVAADIRFPALRRVGYIRGAADRVPEALTAVGVPVEILTERDLDAGDLSVYDAIVVGSRAYETDAELPRTSGRLLDYARAGGLVIVQYQQYGFVQGSFAPFPLEIARPHDRVTDESAKVTRARTLPPRLHDAQRHRPVRLGRLGAGARPLFPAHVGARVHGPAFHGRPRRPRAERRPSGRPPRQGPLRLHGARLLPPASRRGARRVSSVRQPARLEVISKGRKAMKRILLAAAVLLVAGSATAQFQGVADFTITMKGDQGKPMPGAGKMFVGADAFRMEWALDVATSARGKDRPKDAPREISMTMLFRKADPGKLFMLNAANKTYSVFDPKKAADQDKASKETFTVKKLGTATVAGMSCQNVLLTSSKGNEIEVCAAKDFAASDEWLAGFNRREGGGSWMAALKEQGIAGFPVRWSIRKKGSTDALATMEFTRFEKKTLPASLFEVPAGYKQTSMAMGGLTPEQDKQMSDARAQMKEALENMSPEERKAYEDAMKRYGQPTPNH